MTDAEMCKALWIKPIMVCCSSPTAHMLNNGYRCIGDSCAQMEDGGCQYKKLVYPTGDALTKALKAACSSFEIIFTGTKYRARVNHAKAVEDQNENEAFVAACKAMCEVKKQ